ncbi:MAG: 4a-hydroxytetrahydrobiopterin dehydratase [Opitutaceae bacterium]
MSPKQVRARMEAVPRWARRTRVIQRQFQFAGFSEAMDFVNRIAKTAEKADHHPDIDIRWNKVTLALTTHSEGGLTEKDFSMASEADRVFSRLRGRDGPPG